MEQRQSSPPSSPLPPRARSDSVASGASVESEKESDATHKSSPAPRRRSQVRELSDGEDGETNPAEASSSSSSSSLTSSALKQHAGPGFSKTRLGAPGRSSSHLSVDLEDEEDE